MTRPPRRAPARAPGWWTTAAVAAVVAAAASHGCAGPPDGFVLTISRFAVSLDCTSGAPLLALDADVVADDTAGDGDAHVVPVRARFDVLTHSLRVGLDPGNAEVAAGGSVTFTVTGSETVAAGVCDACDGGPLSSFVAPTFIFHVNGARVEAVAMPSALVCN
jgi:hypothetical protein